MYYLIRVLLGIILITPVLVCKKLPLINTRAKRMVTSLLVCAITVLSFAIPIENAFYTFPSAEAVYKYQSTKPQSIFLVLDGKESSFVASGQIHKKTCRIIPKEADGWKIDAGLSQLRGVKRYDSVTENVILETIQYRDTEDYYFGIIIKNFDGEDFEVTDNRNTEFTYLTMEFKRFSKTGNYEYYAACIPAMDASYCITINGEEFYPLRKT